MSDEFGVILRFLMVDTLVFGPCCHSSDGSSVRVPKLGAPRGNSWGVQPIYFTAENLTTDTHTYVHTVHNFTNVPENSNSHAHTLGSGSPHSQPIRVPLLQWARPNPHQNTRVFLNSQKSSPNSDFVRSEPDHLPHPRLARPSSSLAACAAYTSQKRSHCLTQEWPQPAFLHFRKQGHAGTLRRSGHVTPAEANGRKSSGKPVTTILLNPFQRLCCLCATRWEPPPRKRNQEFKRRGKLVMNLLHVVSRRSLHVAFQSSRTLPWK